MSIDSNLLQYELLCVDSAGNSKIKTIEQLIYSLLSNNELWQEPKSNLKQHKIEDSNYSVTVSSIDTKEAPDFAPQTSFRVCISGEYAALEKARLSFISHIKKQEISLIYVLIDEISEQIANEIYPKINKVENRLRRYLIKFFATKLGPDWWKLTADPEMQTKAQQRRNNEVIFAEHVDNKPYLIDFGELGKIVYTQSSGFISRDDIFRKVMSLESHSDAVARLKAELQSNYTKFFKETFKDKGFQGKWEDLEKIRHKVAHNNLFTKNDREQAIDLSNDLLSIIEDADQKIDAVVFSTDEQESIIDSLVQSHVFNSGPYIDISEEDLLKELEQQEELSKSPGKYVGLSRFVKIYLGDKGYDYRNSYNLVDVLVAKGAVEIYDITSAYGQSMRAIRRLVNNSAKPALS